jgi:hypothetical protein
MLFSFYLCSADKPPTRPSRRAVATKKTKYTEVDSSTDTESECDSGTEEAFQNIQKKVDGRKKEKSAKKSAKTEKNEKTSRQDGAARRIDDLTPDVEALCKTVYKQPDGDWRTFAAMDY